jgi:hypothetical protein
MTGGGWNVACGTDPDPLGPPDAGGTMGVAKGEEATVGAGAMGALTGGTVLAGTVLAGTVVAGTALAGAALTGTAPAGGGGGTSSDGGPAARVAARRGLRVRRCEVAGSPPADSPPASPALAVPVRPDGDAPPSLSLSRAVSFCCESLSSVSSIRAISRQAPGRVGSRGTLRAARELVVRAHGDRVGQRGRPRSQARCLYMFLRRARSS